MLLPPLSKIIWNPCSDIGPAESTNTGMVESPILDNPRELTSRMAEPNVSIFSADNVSLKRAFGFSEAPDLDPFLLLDDFHSDKLADYVKVFP